MKKILIYVPVGTEEVDYVFCKSRGELQDEATKAEEQGGHVESNTPIHMVVYDIKK